MLIIPSLSMHYSLIKTDNYERDALHVHNEDGTECLLWAIACSVLTCLFRSHYCDLLDSVEYTAVPKRVVGVQIMKEDAIILGFGATLPSSQKLTQTLLNIP